MLGCRNVGGPGVERLGLQLRRLGARAHEKRAEGQGDDAPNCLSWLVCLHGLSFLVQSSDDHGSVVSNVGAAVKCWNTKRSFATKLMSEQDAMGNRLATM